MIKFLPVITFVSMLMSSCFFWGSSSQQTLEINTDQKISYSDFLENVKAERKQLKNQPISEAKEYFFQLINDKIPSYWINTPWDFNGVTRQPGEGKIACGYFITNTMVDLGFNIERVKLAQAASSVLIDATCVKTKWCQGFDALKNYLSSQPKHSVFIVGLDFHTGYLTKENNDCYFIHSNYINAAGVTKEKIDDSEALKASKVFYIGSITANDDFIKKWVE